MRRLVILALTFCVLFLVPINAFNDTNVIINYDYCVNDYTQVVFKNNLFFALGWDGRIKASSDGITWTLCETSITESISDIEWNGKYYIAVGYDSILISYDGFNWEHKGCASFFFSDIFWDGKKFVATGGQLVGCSISAGVVAWSKDGINWSEIDADFKEKESLETYGYEFIYQDGIYYLLGRGYNSISENESGVIFVLTSKDGLTWKESENKSILNTYKGNIELNGNGISIKFKKSSHELYISSNQKTWQKVVLADDYRLSSAAYGNNKFVLLDDYHGRILASDDAVNWLETDKKNSEINSMVFSGSKFVAVGNDGRILASSDGQKWDIVQLNENYILFSVIYKNGTFVAVGGVWSSDIISNGLILTSVDGINWKAKEFKSDPPFTKIIYQYGKYKIYSSDNFKVNDKLEYTSVKGFYWEPIHQRNKAFIYKTVTNGKNHLALTGNENFEGGLLISKDGVNWDRLYIRFYTPEGLNSIKYNDILWNGKEYIVVGYYQEDEGMLGGGIILYSNDGYHWRCCDGLTSESIDSIAYGNGKTIAFSSKGLLFTLTYNDENTSAKNAEDYFNTYTEPYNYSKFNGTKN